MEWNDNCIARAHVSSLGISSVGLLELYGLGFLEGAESENWMELNNKMENKEKKRDTLFDFIVKLL